MPDRSLAVVGAGVAGLGAAYALADAPVAVTVLEAAARVGGRVVTRRRGEHRYDTGANYVTPAGGRMASILRDLGTDGLVDVEEPVWTFDADGAVSPGDPGRQDDHRWTYESGIEELATRLADRSGATVRTGTTVRELARDGERWALLDDAGESLTRADGVVLTPPAPRTAEVLAGGGWEGELADRLAREARGVPYRTVVTCVLGYPFELDRPYYALVNADREHAVGWLSREACKPGHVPDGEEALIVQMSPAWSTERYDAPAGEATAAAAEHAADLLDDGRLREPAWTDRDRFEVALPDAGVPEGVVEAAAAEGLFPAGDWVVGEGRVSRALLSGVEAAERFERRL